MTRTLSARVLRCFLLLSLMICIIAINQKVSADDDKDKVGAVNQQGDQEKPAVKKPAPPQGRLPNYYKEVISPEQRDKIYAIQRSYRERIATLEAQLKALIEQRDAEVAAVLTAEQLEKVSQLQAEAKAKQQKNRKEKGADPTKTPATTGSQN